MRLIVLAAALIGGAWIAPDTGAVAQTEPWCSVAREGDGENCRFTSYEQCRATDMDGWCVRNSRAAPAAAPVAPTAQIEVPGTALSPEPAPAPAQIRPARKKPDTKQGSNTVRPATNINTVRPATNIVPSRAAANIAIPLPDRALLAPLPEFNCQFDTASLEPTLASTQGNPGADVARIKADYERQCYRHAEIISRDRLQQLQASASTTLSAARRSEQGGAKIPLPDQALLTAASGFDCEFKTAGVDGASAAPSNPVSGQAAPDAAAAAAAVRAKLDFETQCYRHATLILRDRIQHLQASLGETVKAVNRGKPPAGEPRRSSRN